MTVEPTEYEISTIADIAALDPRQRVQCVEDLLRWCLAKDVMAMTSDNAPEGITISMNDTMIWIDDGKAGLSDIRFTMPDGEQIDLEDLLREAAE